MARSATGESVLSRAVRIFEAFTPDERVLSVTQIARRARLHLATASRLIAELESYGLLDREPDRRVRVGVRMWELALRASPTMGLRNASMPLVEDAHAVLGHHVQLQVPAHRDARSAAVAALAAIVPVGTEARTVVGVLTAAARGI